VQCLAIVFGKSKIHRACKKLPATVEAAGGEQFLRARDAEFFSELRAEHVLAAIATRKREIGGAVISSAREIADQQRVFIVGMRRDVKHAAHLAETFQVLKNGGGIGRRLGGGQVGRKNERRHANESAAYLGQSPRPAKCEHTLFFHFRLEIRSSFSLT